MSSPLLFALANHLWQSTLFAALMGCLALLLRKNSARVRYLLWLAASAKFLVPFALLAAIGARIPWPLGAVHGSGPSLASFAGQMAAPLTAFAGAGATASTPVAEAGGDAATVPTALGVIWALGTLIVAASWLARWRLVRRALRESTPASLGFVIPVRSSSSQLEPAVVGVLRPVLLIPRGIEQRLTSEEMHAVLAHEGGHVAWRDNLAAALHMLVEALFWFHPLIWWIGTRLVDERERACDEHVLAEGHRPESYVEGILKVCEHYLSSRLGCIAGVSGANLRLRIEDIMRNRLIEKLSGARKLLIAAAASATMAVPIGIGMLTAPRALAQTGTPDPWEIAFHDVSIRSTPTVGKSPATVSVELTDRAGVRIHLTYPSLRSFIAEAYGISVSQVMGSDWGREPGYDITARVPETAEDPDVSDWDFRVSFVNSFSQTNDPQTPMRVMMRDLLAKHFGLVVKAERRQLDGYVLEIGSAGSKVKPDPGGPDWKRAAWFSPEGFDATDCPFGVLVKYLQGIFQVPVIDRTRLLGTYEYKAAWKSSSRSEPPDPAVVAQALSEQLGLRLEAKPTTVNVINVVSLESPEQVVTHD